MGSKSRRNWNINICFRDDCIFQGKDDVCESCRQFNKYQQNIPKTFTDAYKQPLTLEDK